MRSPPTVLLPRDDDAYAAIAHLPVARINYKHFKNETNRGYRRAELAVWTASNEGIRDKDILGFIWRVEAKILHKADVALTKMAANTVLKIKRN